MLRFFFAIFMALLLGTFVVTSPRVMAEEKAEEGAEPVVEIPKMTIKLIAPEYKDGKIKDYTPILVTMEISLDSGIDPKKIEQQQPRLLDAFLRMMYLQGIPILPKGEGNDLEELSRRFTVLGQKLIEFYVPWEPEEEPKGKKKPKYPKVFGLVTVKTN